MFRNYAQNLVDDLFEEGDRDFHFLNEFLGFVAHIYPEPYMKNSVSLRKNKTEQLRDAMLLANFFIASNAYVGFYMKEYGEIDRTFDDPLEFEEFIRDFAEHDANYFERITEDDRYTIGLMKIRAGAVAPPITSEIKNIWYEK